METGPTPSEELSSTSQAPQPQQYKPPPQMTTTTVQSTMMGQPGMAVYPVNSCRGSARCVAYFDIVISIFAIIIFSVAIAGCVLILNNLDEIRNSDQAQAQNQPLLDDVYLTVIAIILGIMVIGSFIDVCIACSLLSATDVTTSPSVAISKAKCWLWCNIILFVFQFCGCVYSSARGEYFGIGGFLFVILRILFIIIVWKFIKELEISAQSAYLGYAGAQPMTTTAYTYQQQSQQQPYQTQYQQNPYQQYQKQPYQQQAEKQQEQENYQQANQ